jgi:acyl-CoA hydrolase
VEFAPYTSNTSIEVCVSVLLEKERGEERRREKNREKERRELL